VFCLPEQLETEIVAILDLFERVLSRFGFTKYEVMLSTRPAKSVGTDAIWELATDALRGALDIKGWKYEVDEEGGAFYGPKVTHHSLFFIYNIAMIITMYTVLLLLLWGYSSCTVTHHSVSKSIQNAMMYHQFRLCCVVRKSSAQEYI
jgi:hypothetical protein